ncbi:hypothetical protein B0T11DRAFT_77708, partial [Plectosphaerella cucumerina]
SAFREAADLVLGRRSDAHIVRVNSCRPPITHHLVAYRCFAWDLGHHSDDRTSPRWWLPSAPCSQWPRETRDAHLGAIPLLPVLSTMCSLERPDEKASELAEKEEARRAPRTALSRRHLISYCGHKAHRRDRGSSTRQSSASSRLGPQHRGRRLIPSLMEPSVSVAVATLVGPDSRTTQSSLMSPAAVCITGLAGAPGAGECDGVTA